MGALGVVMTVGGGLLTMVQNQQEHAHKQAEARANERLAKMAAADATHRGALEAGRVRMSASQLMERQRVAFAASGVDATVGTPVDAMADSRMMSELDALTIENNAAREAWGYKKQGQQIRRQAAFDRQAHGFRQVGTLLGTAGNAWSTQVAYDNRRR